MFDQIENIQRSELAANEGSMIHFKLLSDVAILFNANCHVIQVHVVDSPARLAARARASSPADARTAATQPPATVSTADDVKTDTRVATAGAGWPVGQVRYQNSSMSCHGTM